MGVVLVGLLIFFLISCYISYHIEKGDSESIIRAFLAQSVERAAFNRKVVGSSPTGGVF